MDRIVAARVDSQRWFERYPRGMPYAVFLLTLAFTIVAVFAIERAERQRRRAEISEVASAVGDGLERRINAHAAYLRSGAVIFSSLPVTRDAFTAFARGSGNDETTAGSEGMAWALQVPSDKITAFERSQRVDQPGFTVWPRPAPGEPFAVVAAWVLYQQGGGMRSAGYNLYAEPARRAALAEAVRNDRPAASGMITLLGSGPEAQRRGILVAMPVFDKALDDVRPALRGVLCSGFLARKLLAAVAQQEKVQGASIALYDEVPTPEHRLTATSGFDETMASLHVPVTLAQHSYVLAVQAEPGATLSTMSILTLLFGLLVAALLTIVATLISRKAAEDRASVLWLREQASIRNSLTRELNHRVKNTLANVLSIVALTKRRATDVESFADSVSGRIRALSATHDLLTQSEWGTTPVRALIEAELAPYRDDGDHQIELQGPEVELAPNDALSLGLAIHELATNAAKYGALSVPGGRLRISWAMIAEDLARIEWVEREGPAIANPRRRGFGTELIEKIVAHELGRPVDLRFNSDGVDCALTVPVRKPVVFRMRAESPS